MRADVDLMVAMFRMTPDEAGGWSAPVPGAGTGTVATGGVGSAVRTRLLGHGTRLRWRRTAGETVLFGHPGSETCVTLRHASRGRVMAVLGDDPAAGHVAQCFVPAGVSHTISPSPGKHALWSEATESGPRGADWEFVEGSDAPPLRPAALVPGRTPRESSPDDQGPGLRPRLALARLSGGGEPVISTSYAVLSREDSLQHLHTSAVDVTYLLHAGGPVRQLALSPDGTVREHVLGRDLASGQIPAVTVPANWWRTSRLTGSASTADTGELHGGPRPADRTRVSRGDVLRAYPRLAKRLLPYTAD